MRKRRSTNRPRKTRKGSRLPTHGESTKFIPRLRFFDAELVGIFVAFKLVVLAAILISLHFLPPGAGKTDHWFLPDTGSETLDAWITPFANWDGQHYLHLAGNGYVRNPTEDFSSLAFFPLYPLAIRLANWVAADLYIAALLLNLILSYLFIHLFYGYARQRLPRAEALTSAALLLAFPSAFFMTIIYSEALFLFCLFGFLYAYQIKKHWASALFAAMMPLTRGHALFVLVAVGIHLGYKLWRMWRDGRPLRLSLVELGALCGFAVGGLAYFAFYHFATGSPLSGIAAQKGFIYGNDLANTINPIHFLAYLFSEPQGMFWPPVNNVVDKIFVVLMLASTVWMVKAKNHLAALVYFALMWGSASMGYGGSFIRFALLGFPFLAIALMQQYPKVKFGWLLLGAPLLGLQIYFAWRFTFNLWIA